MPPIIVISAVIFFLILCLIYLFFSFYKRHPEILTFLNFLILGLTLIALIWYAYDNNRIANQTVESNLRPVVLRDGVLQNGWSDVQFSMKGNDITGVPLMQFEVYKNIAINIRGHVVVNKSQCSLIFSISTSTCFSCYIPSLGWKAPGGFIWAVPNPKQCQATTEENEIHIEYEDIENNKYDTRENKDFVPISRKL